jgi:putative ABC transport system permease protein
VSELFGLSMNYVMFALLALLAVALSTVAYVALRNRVLFAIAVRNIPRRRAQTVLIVIGLMLSTLIISAAFSIGDTVEYSTTNQTYDRLHSIDELVQAQASDDDDPFSGVSSLITARAIPQEQADTLVERFIGIPDVDGAVNVMRGPVPVVHPGTGQSEQQVLLVGLDPARLDGLNDIESLDGEKLSPAALADDELFLNESAADELDAKVGDEIEVYTFRAPHTFTVKEIVTDRMLTGAIFGETNGIVVSLAQAQALFNRPGQVDFIAVSNDGGVRDGVARSAAVTAALNNILDGTDWTATETKKDLVDSASQFASQMTAFFVLLGLFSIASGMLLIFLIFVMLAAERKVEMGMVRAVGTKRRHLIQMFMSEGMAYNIMSAAVGCALGVLVSLIIVGVMARLFAEFDVAVAFNVTPRSLIVSYSLGVVLTFLTVTFSSWRISNLNVVSAIRDIPDERTKRAGRWSLVIGAVCVIAGPLLAVLGYNVGQAFPFMLGVTAVSFGVILLGRFLGAPERPLFSTVGVFLLLFWLVGAGARLPFLGDLEGGIEMFFLSGIAMVAAATFVLVYNADLLLYGVALAGGMFSRLIPSLKTAIAYPLANRFRTGMTIAMIALVVFALAMMSTMNENFDRIFLSEEALGGYDVEVVENPNNPIGDLKQELDALGHDTSKIERADKVLMANRQISEVRMANADADYKTYLTFGLTDDFIANNGVTFQNRAEGLETDADVWRYMEKHPDAAIIDSFALGGDGFSFGGASFTVEGIDESRKTFEPVSIQVRNGADKAIREMEIVGVISLRASQTFYGLYLAPEAFASVFKEPESSVHFVRLVEGADSDDEAKGIESALLARGVQADSLRKLLDESQALSRGFLYLIQGFMGMGLFVGIAAVGVIAFRTVVERRQQIGMLRAIGYSRSAIALSFVMESSFITLLGIGTGISLAIALAAQLVTSDEFVAGGVDFFVPWRQLLLIGGFAFVASLLMTIIPSRQASSIPVAEALRYE